MRLVKVCQSKEINQGAFMNSYFEKSNKFADIVLIGAGPAAVKQLAALAKDKHWPMQKSSTFVIAPVMGGWANYTGEQLWQSTVNELDIGMPGVNLADYVPASRVSPSGLDYQKYLEDCIRYSGVNVIDDEVVDIATVEEFFDIKMAQNESLLAKNVILATGIKGREANPNLSLAHNITLEQAYLDIKSNNFSSYIDKSLVIVGSGNSAMQLASCFSNKIKDVTILGKYFKGFFPLQTDDRFAWRAETQRTCELIVRNAQDLNGFIADRHIRFIIYSEIVQACSRSVEVRYSKAENQNKLSLSSIHPNHSELGHRINVDELESIKEIFDLNQTIWIWAIGTCASFPGGNFLNHLTLDDRGYLKVNSYGQTEISNLFGIGSCVGNPAVNFMDTVPTSLFHKENWVANGTRKSLDLIITSN